MTTHRARHIVPLPSLNLANWWRGLSEGALGELDPERFGWLRVEEFHDGETLVVRAEIPAVDPAKDVDVTVSDGVVKIEARRQEKSEHKEKDGYRTELRYGSFTREIAVPKTVTPENITASYKDGILEVRIPCAAPIDTPATTKVPITQA